MNIDSKLIKNCLLIRFCRIASKFTSISLHISDKSSFGLKISLLFLNPLLLVLNKLLLADNEFLFCIVS